jgi:hypothetical protein
MQFALPTAINDTQACFTRLCALGEGPDGGPELTKVQELLRDHGKRLNKFAYRQAAFHFKENADANPWHVCFAIGLCWGGLARNDPQFVRACVRCLDQWNDADLKQAMSFALQHGDPIEQALVGAHELFGRGNLPQTLPNGLKRLRIAQDQWLRLVVSSDAHAYIGPWNATAMFLAALFAQPKLAATLTRPDVLLPDSGPVFSALRMLHRVQVLSEPPEELALDDKAWLEVLHVNNDLFRELLVGLPDWRLVDVHSGLVMLGTRDPRSKNWFQT